MKQKQAVNIAGLLQSRVRLLVGQLSIMKFVVIVIGAIMCMIVAMANLGIISHAAMCRADTSIIIAVFVIVTGIREDIAIIGN